jgi:hypothetical protein
MNDERLLREVGSMLQGEGPEPPDARQSVRHAMEQMPEVRQRSRWWPYPVFYRRTQTPTSSDTSEFQPNPIPAPNGHIPTVIGRTTSMLSPTKAIIAGALVFGLGGAFLIAQPFGQHSSVPGAAEAGPAESTPFTMRLNWRNEVVQSPEQVTERGVNRSLGDCHAMSVVAPSDPRMDGDVTYCASEHVYGTDRDADPNVATATYRIVNDEGAWQGSLTGVWWTDPTSGDYIEGAGDIVILAGEGAYDGLYAAMTLDWSDIRGLIFEGAPPAGLNLPSAE